MAARVALGKIKNDSGFIECILRLRLPVSYLRRR